MSAWWYQVAFWNNENVLELEGGDDCTVLWVYWMALNCALRSG